MTTRVLFIAAPFLLLAGTAHAQSSASSAPPPPAAGKPVTDREPTAVDVVATPATDLNLKKNEIPPILALAEQDPYVLPGGPRCLAITAEIEKLNVALGDDIDIAQARNGKMSAGKVAQSVVGSFIPFRGVIRQLSGASEQERKLQSAINAGTARRGFLKGVGLQRGCAYPARPATAQVLARIAQQNEAKAAEPEKPRN